MRHTLAHFRKLRESGEKIVMLTCYDASFARLCDQAGVDVMLVGQPEFRELYEGVLGYALTQHHCFLPGAPDPRRIMDRHGGSAAT